MVKMGCVKWSEPYPCKSIQINHSWNCINQPLSKYILSNLFQVYYPKQRVKSIKKPEDHVTSLCKMATVSVQYVFLSSKSLETGTKETEHAAGFSKASRVGSYVKGAVPGYLCYLQLFVKMKPNFCFSSM